MKQFLLLIIGVVLLTGNAFANGDIVVPPIIGKPGQDGYGGGRSLTAVVGTFSADGSELMLTFEGAEGAEADITIVGSNGVIVSESVNIMGGVATIDASSLTPGYYTITIEVSNGDIYTGEFDITSI